MKERPVKLLSLLTMLLGVSSLATACHRTAPPQPALPALPAAPLTEPAADVPALTQGGSGHTVVVSERNITLTGEWDIRLALEEIARTGGYSLIVSPDVPVKRVRLSLVNVPTSAALKAVLDAGQLRLEGSRGLQVPFNPSVVFYQLPVHVDSLSAESIMKRFGVSRDIANLIVQSRKP